MWDVNDGAILQQKHMQLKQLQATKEWTRVLNEYPVITIALAEKLWRRKKKKGKVGRRDLPIINQEMHVDQEAEILLEI